MYLCIEIVNNILDYTIRSLYSFTVLTFMQDDLHHDTVPGFVVLVWDGQHVGGGVVEVVVVRHVSAHSSHGRSRAQRPRPAQLRHLGLSAKGVHSEAGPHHQSQHALFDLLHSSQKTGCHCLVTKVRRVVF